VALPADGSAIAAQRHGQVTNAWAVEPSPPHGLRQLTSNTGVENTILTFNVGLNGTLNFIARRNDRAEVFTIPAGGGEERQLTSGSSPVTSARSLPDGGVIFGRRGEDGKEHLWITDADGGTTRQLTQGAGEYGRALSPDGKVLLYERADRRGELWIIPAQGGEARLFAAANSSSPLISRDSRWIAYQRFRPGEGGRFDEVVVPVTGGPPVATLLLPLRANRMQWTPDAKAISYQDEADSSLNVHLQPIDGGAPRPLTSFRDGRILDHRWARDGSHLIVTRRVGNRVNLWSTSPEGRNPTQLTDFPTGEMFGLNTPASGRPVLFVHGTENSDVVLIRGLR
jgi:Tol biopolymer transport system component